MEAAEKKQEPIKKTMDEIVALCKRRGFVFQASDIYGGLNGFWDYGPMGVLLKNNIRDLWWRDMVLCPPIGPDGHPIDMVGLDSAIIQHPEAWVASGHAAGFNDPMVDCKETKLRYRADHVKVFVPKSGSGIMYAFMDESEAAVAKKIGKLEKDKSAADFHVVGLPDIKNEDYPNIIAPEVTKPGTLTTPRAFNLMFKTYVGATASEDNMAYLRPETAQGIFLNFKNITSSSRVKVPFGVAQVGTSYRNEVTPRNFIFRTREFEQMEMEFFCHKDDAKMWYEFWQAERMKWWLSIGLQKSSLQLRKHDQDELSHYAKEGAGTSDIEFKYPFTDPGFGELEGIAHRSNFDLNAHQKHSKTKLEYFDTEKNMSFLPDVIEPAAGLTRGVLAVLCDAFTPDPTRASQMYLKFDPKVAPIKAGVFPLVNKDGLPEIAEKLYLDLRKTMTVQMDEKQSIGKRYARMDEAGTPFSVTIDHDSLNDHAATIRHRDTQAQDRVALDKVKAFITEKVS